MRQKYSAVDIHKAIAEARTIVDFAPHADPQLSDNAISSQNFSFDVYIRQRY